MSDNITVRGFVATDIKSSTTPGGVGTASFRMGSTERRFDRSSNTWVDGTTNWFTVQGYRQLAGNLGCSIRKGQRVIVVGRLKMRSWEKDGRIYHVAEIDAESVGHDLMWGSANFTRTAGNGSHPAEQPAGGPQGDGQPGDGQQDGAAAGSDREGHALDQRDVDGDDPSPDDGFPDDADGDDGVDRETGELKDTAA